MGWAFVLVPAVGGIVEMLLPWELAGTIVGLVAMGTTIVMIGLDARSRGQSAQRHVLRAIAAWVIYLPLYARNRATLERPGRLGYVIAAVVLFHVAAFYRPCVVPDRVLVRCRLAGPSLRDGIACSVEHAAGRHSVEACWDVFLTCTNGPGGSGHACGTVAPERSAPLTIPYSDLVGVQGCDRVTNVDVLNAVVEAE